MRITGAMLVLNGGEHIKVTLPNLYATCDQVIIVESAARWAWDMADDAGLSLDGTASWLDSFPDPEHKLTRIQLGRVDSLAQSRNAYRDFIPEEHLLVNCDQDEVFFPEDLRRAVALLEALPEISLLLVDYTMLWGDLRQAARRHWRSEGMIQRRCSMGPYQVSPQNTGDNWEIPDDYRDLFPDPPIRWFHLGWVGTPGQLFMKTLLQYRYAQDFGWGGDWSSVRNLSLDEMAWEIVFNHHSFTRHLPPGMETEPVGELPPCLRQHSWYGKAEAEIFDEDWKRQIQSEVMEGRVDLKAWLNL